MGQHLLVLSLGPVQDFIASARRFRDLWYGSWLLANLAREAAKAMDQQGATLIFPAPQAGQLNDPDFSPANKLVALVDRPAESAKAATEAAQAFLMAELDEVCTFLSERHAEHLELDRATAKAQVAEWLEVQWASVPVGGSYVDARQKAEFLLAARKNTRQFTAVGWNQGEVGERPKSSLDGQREAVLKVGKGLANQPEKLAQLGLRTGEALCGLGLLKRFGKQGEAESKVPSTSHMAAVGSAARTEPDQAEPAIQRYLDELEGLAGGNLPRARRSKKDQRGLGQLNGAALYPERLEELGLPKAALPKALQALKEALKASGMKQPSPYYALLLGDGDRMGQAIDRLESPKDHQALSRALEGFADEAKKIVSEHLGTTVYAGGDDVMAMLPLDKALPAARALAEEFAKKLKDYPTPEGSPTFSVGLAVVHHLEPLSDALTVLRQAEAKAKGHGRNALCLVVDKRSGSANSVVAHWNEKGGLDVQLQEAAKLLASGQLPDGAAYELRQLASDLKGWTNAEVKNEAARAEAKRILKRKRPEDEDVVLPEVLQTLDRWMADGLEGVERTAELLVNARLFAEVLPQGKKA